MSGLIPQRGTATSINEDEDGSVLSRLHHIRKFPVCRDRRFEFGRNGGDGFQEAQQQTALDRVIDILRQRPARRERCRRIQLGRHHAHHVAALVHQRAARIARLHRQADLKIARVILDAGEAAISPLVNLGAKPCKPILGKPTVATVLPKCAVRLGEMGSGANRPSAFSKAKSLAAST